MFWGPGLCHVFVRILPGPLVAALVGALGTIIAALIPPPDPVPPRTTIPSPTTTISSARPLTRIPTASSTIAPTPTTPPRRETPQPTTTTPPPDCSIAVADTFLPAWHSKTLRARIGCPEREARHIEVAEQPFEGGYMLWPSGAGKIIVLFYADYTWDEYLDTWDEDGGATYPCPEIGDGSSPGTPRRGFGKLWCEIEHVRDKLGEASKPEWSMDKWVQQFERGTIIQSERLGAVILFRDEGTWDQHKLFR